MAGLKEIKRRLASVKNTKKITYAMKLVSAAKLKRAQDAVANSREYSNALYQLVGSLMGELASLSHPLIAVRPVKKIRLILIGGARGLAGGYNANINRKIDATLESFAANYPGASVEIVVFGRKVAEHLKRIGIEDAIIHEGAGDDVSQWPLREECERAEADFISGDVDSVWMLHTKFKSALSMTVECEELMPLKSAASIETGDLEKSVGAKIEFEPSAAAVLEVIIPRIVRAKLYQAGLEAKASEHGSRMTAMDSATKNAGDIIELLRRKFNRLRQSGITSELLDIIGGAEAIK